MSDEVADALANGREYIEKNGWWRGHLVGPNGHQACALGGLLLGNGQEAKDAVFRKNLVLQAAVVRLAGVIDSDYRRRSNSHVVVNTSAIADWNDRKTRCKDKQDLLDTFAKAEKIERAGYDPDA